MRFLKFLSCIVMVCAEQGNTTPGNGLKELIECFTWWDPQSASRPGFSQLEGCDETQITFCKTDKGFDDVFCEFHGDNHLTPYDGIQPECFFCCGMETCNSWDEAHDENSQRCIDNLLSGGLP